MSLLAMSSGGREKYDGYPENKTGRFMVAAMIRVREAGSECG